MPEFSLHAAYCTPTGRPGTRDVLRKAPNMATAIAAFHDELASRGHTKIDIRAWPANTWKEARHG